MSFEWKDRQCFVKDMEKANTKFIIKSRKLTMVQYFLSNRPRRIISNHIWWYDMIASSYFLVKLVTLGSVDRGWVGCPMIWWFWFVHCELKHLLISWWRGCLGFPFLSDWPQSKVDFVLEDGANSMGMGHPIHPLITWIDPREVSFTMKKLDVVRSCDWVWLELSDVNDLTRVKFLNPMMKSMATEWIQRKSWSSLYNPQIMVM